MIVFVIKVSYNLKKIINFISNYKVLSNCVKLSSEEFGAAQKKRKKKINDSEFSTVREI